MRDSGLVSTGPNLAKSIFGHGSRPRRGSVRRGAAGRGYRGGCGRSLGEIGDVLRQDAAAPSASLHLTQVDAALARKLADRWPGIRDVGRHLRRAPLGRW